MTMMTRTRTRARPLERAAPAARLPLRVAARAVPAHLRAAARGPPRGANARPRARAPTVRGPHPGRALATGTRLPAVILGAHAAGHVRVRVAGTRGGADRGLGVETGTGGRGGPGPGHDLVIGTGIDAETPTRLGAETLDPTLLAVGRPVTSICTLSWCRCSWAGHCGLV